MAAPINATNYVDRRRSFLDARLFAAMYQNDDRIDFIEVHCVEIPNILGEWKKGSLVFGCSEAPFLASGELPTDMPYLRCRDTREFVAAPSTLVALLKVSSHSSSRVHFCSSFDWAYNFLPVLENPGSRGCDCEFEGCMRTASRLDFADLSDVELLAVTPSGHGPLHVFLSQ